MAARSFRKTPPTSSNITTSESRSAAAVQKVRGVAQIRRLDQLPNAYRQGQLDALCGVYSVINASRFMMKSACLHKNLGAWELLVAIVGMLEEKRKFADITCNGMRFRDHDRMLDTAKRFLLGKHGLVLEVRKPLVKLRRPTAKQAFRMAKDHLENSGTAVFLSFETEQYGHWTVISAIAGGKVYFFDSTGMRPKPIDSFRLTPDPEQPLRKKFEFRKSGIVFARISEP